MFRIDSYLIALEGFQKLELVVSPELALEAFTKASGGLGEGQDAQTYVERGMGRNYERLEFLGDCFLKMAVTISLFSQQPKDNEYFLHVDRMTRICNKNLRGNVINSDLCKHVRSMGFRR